MESRSNVACFSAADRATLEHARMIVSFFAADATGAAGYLLFGRRHIADGFPFVIGVIAIALLATFLAFARRDYRWIGPRLLRCIRVFTSVPPFLCFTALFVYLGVLSVRTGYVPAFRLDPAVLFLLLLPLWFGWLLGRMARTETV